MPPTVRMDLLPTIEDVSPDTSSKADYSNSISAALQPPPSVVLDYVDDYEVSQNLLLIIIKRIKHGKSYLFFHLPNGRQTDIILALLMYKNFTQFTAFRLIVEV